MQPLPAPHSPAQFKHFTFWDVDVNTLDVDKHRVFIVKRVASHGTQQDVWLLFRLYTPALIKDAVYTPPMLEGKAGAYARFLAHLYDEENCS